MAYTKQIWQNGPQSSTPISASRLGYMENGIQGAAATADTALAGLQGKASVSDLGLALDTIRGQAFGGAARTKPYHCLVRPTANFGYTISPAMGDKFDIPYTAISDQDSMFKGIGVGGGGNSGYPRIIIPVAGTYHLQYALVGNPAAAGSIAINLNANTGVSAPNINAGLIFGQVSHNNGLQRLDYHITCNLGAATVLYWSVWSTTNLTVNGSTFAAPSVVMARYVGPPS